MRPNNDIVILKLSKPLNLLKGKVWPACLPSPDWAPETDSSYCMASGWGDTENESQ